MRFFQVAASALTATAMIGCASQPKPVSSTEGSTLVQTGYVTDVRDVTVSGGGRNSAVGSFVGSILGGIAGSNIGGGNGQVLTTIGGAAAGGIAGQQIGKPGSKTSTKLTVRFTGGDTRVYDVEGGETFRVGDQVKVITNNSNIKVTH